MSFESEIDRIIKEQGFELWGATPIENFDELVLNITDFYFKNNFHATMEWLKKNIDVRLYPKKKFPQANTIIVVGKNYFRSDISNKVEIGKNSEIGYVSKYALGEDYHKSISEKLQKVAGFLLQNGAMFARYYVDTGPVFEKYWAVKSQLGWIGKNSLLINRKLGSFLFLGVILTDLRIQNSQAAIPLLSNYCGSCTRCIESCPTGAIVSNGVVDANKCIAYLTIEHRGVIKRELRESIGNWIFGCDICQDVCPWNIKFARPTVAPVPFLPDKLNMGLTKNVFTKKELLQLLKISEKDFNIIFKDSPVKRAKWEGFVRNIMIAVANLKIKEAILILKEFLSIPNPVLKATAIWALCRLKGIEEAQLTQMLQEEKYPQVIEEIRWVLNNNNNNRESSIKK